MTSKTKGFILVLLSAVMFGSYGILSKLVGDAHGIFYPGWTRSLLIALVLFPIVLLKKQIVPIKKDDWKWMAVFLIITSLTQAPLFYAFNNMDVGTATLLFFVTMLLTIYGVGFLFLGEKITKVKIIAFIIAATGLYITFSFSVVAFSLLAALMAIVNGVASGGEVAFSKKLTGSYSSLYLIWLSWLVIAITNAVVSVWAGETQYPIMLNTFWLYQCVYAVAGMVGFWLVIEGFKYVEASIGGLLGLLEIVFSILLGFIVFHEGLSTKVVAGGILILCAASLPHIVELFGKKNINESLDTETAKQKLTDEGFAYVYEWTDEPNTEYPEHAHKGKVSFYVVKGSIDMNVGGAFVAVAPGGRIDVPVGVPHTAKVGPEGCTFVVGEEIEGDS